MLCIIFVQNFNCSHLRLAASYKHRLNDNICSRNDCYSKHCSPPPLLNKQSMIVIIETMILMMHYHLSLHQTYIALLLIIFVGTISTVVLLLLLLATKIVLAYLIILLETMILLLEMMIIVLASKITVNGVTIVFVVTMPTTTRKNEDEICRDTMQHVLPDIKNMRTKLAAATAGELEQLQRRLQWIGMRQGGRKC